jgi:hypothetical protein
MNLGCSECLSCDSSTSANCVDLIGNIPTISCESNDSCATWIEGAVTYRGCSRNMSSEIKLFKTCDTDNYCNDEIFPENRLQCVSCFGSDCLSVKNNNLVSTCRNYFEDDKCYTNVISTLIISTFPRCFCDCHRNL